MDIMTKVRVLWEKVAGITADVSAVDAKATATAATLAGILPRIPKDYSENETATGVKWIDGKEIYKRVINGTLPEITSTSNQVVGALIFDNIVETEFNYTATNGIIKANNNILYNKTTNNITVLSVTSSFSEYAYTLVVYYTKPDPVPAQVDNETRKRKTTKKEDK